MTTYNTGNQIGSTDSRDRLDNTENMDYLENSTTELTHADRLGTVRKTRHGMEVEHDAQIAAHETEHDAQMQSFENDFDGRLAGMAFTRVGSFATGATLTDMRQVLVWEVSQGGDGHEYGWAGTFPKVVAAGATPATSGGIFAGAWVDRTDVTLRSDLASESGSGLVGYQPAGTGAVATTVQSKLRGAVISVFDFMTDSQRADAMSANPSVDCTSAVQKAVDHALTLSGRVTIEGYGLCVISGTVNFTQGETRKPIYFYGGGYKKTNSGFMFSASVDNTGEIYFDNVYFESVSGAGTKIFNTDYIIRLHTTNCVFRGCDCVWYSGDDVSIGFAYSQSCRSVSDTVVQGAGYAFDLAAGFEIVFDSTTIEQRESGIRVRSGQGAHNFRVINCALEGLSGTAIRFEASALSVQIENNYFELNQVGHVVFTSGAIAQSVIAKGNLFVGAVGGSGFIWPANCQNVVSIANNSYTIPLHNTDAITLGGVWSHADKGYTLTNLNPDKVAIFGQDKYKQATVSGKTVTTTYLGQFQRLTVQETHIVPNAATTDYTVDFGVATRTDDIVSIQCNTTADVRLLKYRKSGNTIIYTVRNDTGSAQSTTFTICVLKPNVSVIG